MASIGRISEFNPYEEDIESYVLRLKHFFKANDIKDGNKVSILITVIGPKVLSVLSDIISPKKIDEESYDDLCKVLIEHYAPKRLVVAERYMFYSRVQKSTETISEFVVAIKHLASSCEFKSFLTDALRDKLISGISNDGIRQKLLSEELDFNKALAFALRLEQAERQTGLFVNNANNGTSKCFNMNMKRNVSKGGNPNNFTGAKLKSKEGKALCDSKANQFKCFRCGNSEHAAKECPYVGYKCNSCKKVGHLSKMCINFSKKETT